MPWNKGVSTIDSLPRTVDRPTSDPLALPGGWSPSEGQTGPGCRGWDAVSDWGGEGVRTR